MYFDPIYPHPPILCPLYTPQCGTIHWVLVDLPKDIPLKKTDFRSPRSHPMPVAHQKGVGDHAALSSPHWLLTGLIL